MFTPGQSVTWVWKPRGGYGYEIPCRAEVVRLSGKRVQIRVWSINRITREETPELKFVRPESLRLKAS
jgi:hypothetical protein